MLTPVVPAGLTGKLLYTLDFGLWTLDLQRGQARQIQPPGNAVQVQWARWSPDGTQVVYGTFGMPDGRSPVAEVFLAGADGSNPHRILGGEAGRYFQVPVWGPDGQSLYVLYSAQAAGERTRRLERHELATGARHTVSDKYGFDVRRFDVSPDGRWLVMAAGLREGAGLLLVDLESGEERVLLAGGQFEEVDSPRFDPASRQVLFAAGNAPRATEPASPFGPRVARAHGVPLALYTVPVAGGGVRRLTTQAFDDPVAAWSPDGTRIVILSTEALALLPATGGDPTPVLRPGGTGAIDWVQ